MNGTFLWTTLLPLEMKVVWVLSHSVRTGCFLVSQHRPFSPCLAMHVSSAQQRCLQQSATPLVATTHPSTHCLHPVTTAFRETVTPRPRLKIINSALPSLVNSIPFPPRFMKTLTSSCRPSRTSSTHLLPLALYHVIWRLPSSNLCWKSHHLTKNLLKNYCPISNLPFLSKILEKIVLHKLLYHLQENNLSNPFHSAYRAGHSTETVLLRIVNDILSAPDNDNISVLLLLDLSAAFNTIDHQILLSRLNSVFGIQSTALQWFQSYLSDRYQSTSVNNSRLRHHHSSCTMCLRAQYWGLFVLYTIPLSDIITSHSVP